MLSHLLAQLSLDELIEVLTSIVLRLAWHGRLSTADRAAADWLLQPPDDQLDQAA